MTDRELLQQALDALELTGGEYLTSKEIEHLDALEIALRARLAQPEPEPVAWRRSNWSGSDDDYVYRDYDDPLLNTKGENVGEPLYTAPPKLEWVGLTDDELIQIGVATGLERAAVMMITNKLKEKNT